VDGFNLSYAISPGAFEDIVRWLFPELRRRGVFWDDNAVPGGAARQNYSGSEGSRLADNHLGVAHKWRAGEEQSPFAQKNSNGVKRKSEGRPGGNGLDVLSKRKLRNSSGA
jgi:hypothetical protein